MGEEKEVEGREDERKRGREREEEIEGQQKSKRIRATAAFALINKVSRSPHDGRLFYVRFLFLCFRMTALLIALALTLT